jgi:fructose-1,6-bisphosphatase/inositol monophosphatase family enzyme
MPDLPTPRQILTTLLPQLRLAAAYAQQIQASIAVHPDKYDSENFFATALTDADLSIQTLIEVALLAHFPQLRFHGEEYETSYNTKYFRATELGPMDDYLVTLDPIDGTRFYMDGHPNYQIILTVLNADHFEAVLALSPAQDTYYYALRGQGAYQGSLADDLEACRPLRIDAPLPQVLLGWDMEAIAPKITGPYTVIRVKADYAREKAIPTVNGLLTGEITGVILARGKFIDGAALAFLAQEMGYIVTAHDGLPLPPLHTCQDYQWPGLIVASTAEVHRHLREAVVDFTLPPVA